jgi:hypothetical protein
VEQVIELKGGHMTLDPKLDRIPQFDERSKKFNVRYSLATGTPTSHTWYFGGAPWRSKGNLDQGAEGACVGFGWTQELIASPAVSRFKTLDAGNAFARDVYHRAQKLDEWPGEDYEGTSVLAGAKAVSALGFIPEYRWAFSVDDLMLAVSHLGPAVVGTSWMEGMDRWDKNGVLTASGNVRGGHCYLIRGVLLNPIWLREPVFRITNSWGDDWGIGGDAFIRVSDFEKLMKDGGEACIPMRRTTKA